MTRPWHGAAIAVLALAAGLSVLPAHADSSDHSQWPTSTGTLGKGAAPGGPVTRDQVLARARHWAEQRVGYSWVRWWSDSATGGGYRQDCSGFVSMAWQLKESYDTTGLFSVADRITWEQLQPGDALDIGGVKGHAILFAGWTDKAKDTFRYYSESNSRTPTSAATARRGDPEIGGHPTSSYVPLRYRKITDTPVPPPPVPPAPSAPVPVPVTPAPAPVPSLPAPAQSSAPASSPAPASPSAPTAEPAPSTAPAARDNARPSPSATEPAPAPAAPPRRTLRNVATGLCVDVPTGGVPNMGHPVVQEHCDAGTGHLQQVDLVPGTGGASGFALRPAGSTLCVDPPNYGAPANAQVGLYPCDYSSADNHLWLQRWNSERTAFLLVNAKSADTPTPMCLDVPGHADSAPGLRLGVYPCHPEPGDDHWWTLA
ncbi:ricin-type beta-trefoil lectin protein [Streptomyces sp. 1114.5]|uniref:RICIN domain-containing protein n=1 Tax=Streptomyces sp. 1114.5 TaxID=1938830 RepID=UPI000F2B19B7|nr:RICIN domain-containing protein [Streptomyces sp. 1114.5]RKT09230.1 ricin-type beta-trefoil lectin protein [Streptomyces sp. 1114.5]